MVTGAYWDAANGVSPITRPDFSDPVNNPRAMGATLWGDEPGEKMSDFAAQAAGTGGWYFNIARGYLLGSTGLPWDQPAVYQPPKSGSGYSFEFSGDILPDYTTLCLDCHSSRMSAANPPVNWGQGIGCTDNSVDPPDQRIECGAQHGLGAAGTPWYVSDGGTAGFWGSSGNPDVIFDMNYVTRGRHNGHFMRWPYDSAERSAGINFVMSCTDCHEAHGSDRGGMVRERFNVNANGDCGTGGNSNPDGENCNDGGNWNSFCNACHYYYGGQHTGMSCGNASCHEANSIHRIIHTVDSGAGTQLMLTAAGYEANFQRPDFTPEISGVEGHIGSDELLVTFNPSQYGSGDPGIFTNEALTGAIEPDDFWLFDTGSNNPRTITNVSHSPGAYTATVTMSAPLALADLDNDTLATRGKSIWAWYQGGYNNWATGIVPEQVVSAGPWPATITGPPLVGITAVAGITGYDRLYVAFSEGVYANADGTGALQASDFTLVDGDNGRNIASVIHTAGADTVIVLLDVPLDEFDDIDSDTLAAAGNAIYDQYGAPAATDPVTITAKSNAPSITLVYGIDGHNRIVVRFSEAVYANPDGTGALAPADFVYVDVDGKGVTAVEHTPGDFSAALILDGPVDAANDIGIDTLAAAGAAIYDVTGYPAPTTPATLAQGLASFISTVEGIVGDNELKVTFQTQAYANVGETGALQTGDLALIAGGKSISSVQHAAGSSTAIITMDGNLEGGDVSVATLAAANSSIFGPRPGNFPLGTNTVTITAQLAPAITKVEGAVGYDRLTVFFSEGVYGGAGQSGALTPADFVLTDVGNDNNRAITAVQHNPGSSVAILTMSANLAAADGGSDTLAAASNEIFNNIDNPVGTDVIIMSANDCPAWGTQFDFNEAAGSAATTGDSGLLVGNVGDPAFSMLGDGLYSGDETEAQATYIDLNTPGYDQCLMSPRAFTLETRFFAGDVDLDYVDNDGNGFDDDYDVGDDPFGEAGDGRNYTGMRIIERKGTFQLTIFRAGYAGDYVASRAGQVRVILKYRTDDSARHTCPYPQWPDDDYAGNDAAMHQISTDIEQWPIMDNHWYQIRVVFNADKSNIPGSNGTPVDIFLDDLGTDGSGAGEIWAGYVNASRTINESSSCRWGALPGDFVRTSNQFAAIGDNLNHADIPGDRGNLMLKGALDWVRWLPVADYSGVDNPPH